MLPVRLELTLCQLCSYPPCHLSPKVQPFPPHSQQLWVSSESKNDRVSWWCDKVLTSFLSMRLKDKQLLLARRALRPLHHLWSDFPRQGSRLLWGRRFHLQHPWGHTDAGTLTPGTYLQLQPESAGEPGSGLQVHCGMESWVYLLFS